MDLESVDRRSGLTPLAITPTECSASCGTIRTVDTAEVSDKPSQSLAFSIYRTLKQSILAAELSPGYILREVELSQRFGSSRTPVREALRMLIAEGLVASETHKGARVADMSRKDMLDAYDIREWLEPEAAAKAASLARAELCNHLNGLLRELPKQVITYVDALEVGRIDVAFHNAIIEATDNRFLVDAIRNARSITQRAAHFTAADRQILSHAEHQAIASAIADKDGDAAREAMKLHIRATRRRLLLD